MNKQKLKFTGTLEDLTDILWDHDIRGCIAYSDQNGHSFRSISATYSDDIGHLSERSDAGCLNL